MKIQIEIPKEFEKDYNNDKFSECFLRILADLEYNIKKDGYRAVGNYELETVSMFLKAFEKSLITLPEGLFIEEGILKGQPVNKDIAEFHIPDEVTKIDDAVFKNCIKLESVTGGQNVTEIGESTFEYCYNLEEVNLPNVTNIGVYAFYRCTNLQEVDFPKATYIEEGTFGRCKNLKKIDLPNVTEIRDSAFEDCENLKTIHYKGYDIDVSNVDKSNIDIKFLNQKVEELSIEKEPQYDFLDKLMQQSQEEYDLIDNTSTDIGIKKDVEH